MGKSGVTIRGLATDSRRVVPGSLFFALAGMRTDGHLYIEEAIDRGAVAVVCEKECWVPPHVTLILADDMRQAVGTVASRFYGHPGASIRLTGVLGTSGKTVVSTMLKHFMQPRGPIGLLGTISYEGLLAQIRNQSCSDAILEVSSHGIDQKRVAGLSFKNLVLLNLSPEHMDYHGSLENYVSLERDFICEQASGLNRFVASLDDSRVRRVIELAPDGLKEKILTFGCSADAVIRAEDVRYSERDTRFKLVWPEGSVRLVSPLLGEFNLQNTLAALATGYAEGIDPVDMGAALLTFEYVRGRMERLEMDLPFTVLIDYMHTEASYAKGIDMVRELTEGRLITVFGCGGDRDRSSRPVITSIVAGKCDQAIATADNPRNETISGIFADMRKGNETAENLSFIEDRRAAIATALEMAGPGDTVLIAGKGHETFQELEDCVVAFDDRGIAREILQNKQWHSR
jgi:UDP-N-acetylmuramoyl-L-alanyl-D-glutamate--2,6-diaminopimelate ligase